ncbi:uncharacterized protein N7482_001524 [Penicillium canariense]|uniref:Zn(2)-C6 fungal-type domain-containing protein n=1 Tax=Penicillium canariense TaxID=189055 RepID=A0A9W9IFX8_9EURO|nr:uncharacterized protein N7482_001524 [Penicillium canariense]KAJ5175647.1 hypothetical protein N7482_001524 [Penicillium canariense]
MSSEYPEPPSRVSHGVYGVSPRGGDDYGLGSHPARTSTDPGDSHGDIKRARACEPCRQLKVRCDTDPTHPNGSCKRCAKSGRACIVTAPTRKRQKKTDSRVTELEHKIDALTATLQASHGASFNMAQPAQQGSSHSPDLPGRRWLREDPHLTGNKRHHDGLVVSQYPRQNSPSAVQIPRPQPSKHWRVPAAGDSAPPKVDNEFVDVIDRGVVDVESAQAAFDRYVTKMAPEMPMVVFPPGTTMGSVRREKPALFLAILAVAIAPFQKEVQAKLCDDVYRLIAERVVVRAEKSLELVQTLLVCVIWYSPPDNIEELKFYQLIHLAVILAMDIGLNRRTGQDDRPLTRLREVLNKKPVGSPVDLDGPEAKRTWVGCYFMSVQVSTALRRVHLVRWQSYMDESLHTLETHPDALPSDKSIIWWAKLGLIMEESGVHLLADDSENMVSFADSKVRYTVKAFSNQLAQWRREIPEEFFNTPLAHTYHVINLFVHESAISVDCKEAGLLTSRDKDLPTSIAAPLIDAVSTCINSIHQALDMITKIEPDRLICLPTVALARTNYPVVSLIKIYSLLVASDSRIGQMIDTHSLKVEYYLERVIAHYRAAAALDGGRAASKFGNIMMMLRNWFIKKKENGPALRELFGTETLTDIPSDRQSRKTGTTPLHLLSEVAMGDPANRAPSTGSQSHLSRSSQENVYTASTSNRDPGHTPGHSAYGTADTPLSRTTSTSEHAPPGTTWHSTPPFSGPVPGNSGPEYYPAFTSPGPSQAYAGMPSSSGAGQQGYADMSNMVISLSQPMGMLPEMGTETSFDPDNLFTLGTMMDEGLFTFPLAFDGSFQF